MSRNWIILCLLAAPAAIQAQTVTGRASATIVRPLTLAVGTPMNFGAIMAPGPGTLPGLNTTVILHGDGTTTLGGNLRPLGGVAATAATFTATGTPHANFHLRPIAPFQLRRVGGTETMTVTVRNWRGDRLPGNAGRANAIPLDGGGQRLFTLESTLEVGAAQAPGDYTATYPVTVEYQ